jgi:hypothetical protein
LLKSSEYYSPLLCILGAQRRDGDAEWLSILGDAFLRGAYGRFLGFVLFTPLPVQAPLEELPVEGLYLPFFLHSVESNS